MWEVNLEVNLRVKSSKTGTKFSKTRVKSSKTGTKLSKTWLISRLNPVKRPCKPQKPHKTVYFQPGTLKQGCVLIPLGSPTGVPERSYVHAPAVCTWWSSWYIGGYGDWGVPGWGIPGGYGEGYTGYYPARLKAEG